MLFSFAVNVTNYAFPYMTIRDRNGLSGFCLVSLLLVTTTRRTTNGLLGTKDCH